jgi:hypothetical protein
MTDCKRCHDGMIDGETGEPVLVQDGLCHDCMIEVLKANLVRAVVKGARLAVAGQEFVDASHEYLLTVSAATKGAPRSAKELGVTDRLAKAFVAWKALVP